MLHTLQIVKWRLLIAKLLIMSKMQSSFFPKDILVHPHYIISKLCHILLIYCKLLSKEILFKPKITKGELKSLLCSEFQTIIQALSIQMISQTELLLNSFYIYVYVFYIYVYFTYILLLCIFYIYVNLKSSEVIHDTEYSNLTDARWT